jgi:3-hydroxyisobutyrate dehydrogenase-like beta-hydroxyacid dehydrogenase
MTESSVGFIGLGAMGSPMAKNLIKNKIPLIVFDLDDAKCASLKDLGAKVAKSPADLAKQSNSIICMVETTAQVLDVINGIDGIMQSATRLHNIACMSTIDPLQIKSLTFNLKDKGVGFVDAPVSGAVEGATAGTLSIFASGNEQAIAAFERPFAAISSQVFNLGEAGQGTAAKLVNNMLFQINNVAVAEAITLGLAAGIAPQMLFELIKVSSGNSFAFQIRAPRMINRDFTPGGKVDISYKDQELQTSLAKSLGVVTPLAAISQQVYQMAKGLGYGREDGSAVIKVYELMSKKVNVKSESK